MSSMLPDLDIKEFGEFKAMQDMGSALDLLVTKRIESKQAYNLISLELDELAAVTRINPQKLLDVLLREEAYSSLFTNMSNLIKLTYGDDVEPSVLDSLVESTFILDRLRSLAVESSSPRKTLGYVARVFSIDADEVTLTPPGTDYVCEVMVKPRKVIEALELNHETFGMESEDIFSMAMIATTGMLIGARDQQDRLVGVGDFIYDRDESFFIYSICVRKGFEGHNIGESIIQKALDQYPGKRFWVTVGAKNLNSMKKYFRSGFKMRKYLKDNLGEGINEILLERLPGEKTDVPDAKVVNAFDSSLKIQGLRYTQDMDLKEILNTHGYEVSMLAGSPEATLLLEKSRQRFSPSRLRDDAGTYDFSGLHTYVSDSVSEALKASELDKRAHGPSGEEPNTLIMICRTGLMVCANDEKGELMSLVPVVFDRDGGLFCHGVAVDSRFDELEVRYHMMGYVEGLGERYGKESVWTTADTVDTPVMEVNINRRGYVGRRLVLNYYGPGEHRMVVEKILGGEKREAPDWGGLPIIQSHEEYMKKKEKPASLLVMSVNYALLAKLLDSGYQAVRLIWPDEYKSKRYYMISHPLFLLTKDEDKRG